MDFRRDINALRAVAVLAVVLYHFSVPGFSGGFVGVDVFFVISGYLMAGIILRGVYSNSFKISEFYTSRAIRIIPALFFLIVFLIFLSWFILLPPDYRQHATHSIWALFFVSNVRFYRESGYFDTESLEKLLLHTWSLSVEWQFYILFPLFLLLVWRFFGSVKSIVVFLLFVFFASFGWSVYLSLNNPSAAFYLLPSRAWEMIAGALVYMSGLSFKRGGLASRLFEFSGYFLILLSVFSFHSSLAWPGFYALVPVLGTMFVLVSTSDSFFSSELKSAQFLGNISYSLYLWHWPFAVLIYFSGLHSSLLGISAGLILSLAFAYFSWVFIENPSKRLMKSMRLRWSYLIIFTMFVFVLIPSIYIRSERGIYSRFSEDVEVVFREADNRNPRMGECHRGGNERVPECVYGGHKLGAIVLGDSHAQSFVRTVEKLLPHSDLHVLDWTMSGCPTIAGVVYTVDLNHGCSDFVEYAINSLTSVDSGVPLLVVNRYSSYIEGPNELGRVAEARTPQHYVGNYSAVRTSEYYDSMKNAMIETYCKLSENHNVYVFLPIPELVYDVPRVMARSMIFGKSTRVSVSYNDYLRRNDVAISAINEASSICNVTPIDPTGYLCSDGYCWGDYNGIPLYYDDDHLSERGAYHLRELIKPIFK